MIQKHISSKNLNGEVKFNKNVLADISELVRLSPTSCRILLFLIAYSDDNNSVITNVKTISRLVGIKENNVNIALNKLIKNGYVEIKKVQLKHSKTITGVYHDKKLYHKSRKKVWKVTGEKFIADWKLHGIYNRFYINENIIKCENNQYNNIIRHVDGNLFYDSRISDNEIIWEM